jgi:hypothetical protein
MMIEYKVVSGDLLLGIYRTHQEAVSTMRRFNQEERNGPFARIIEIDTGGENNE